MNRTIEVVSVSVSGYCNECVLKSKKTTTHFVKPLRSQIFLSRIQIDLVDMQSLKDGDYKYILNIQDHFTKFNILRPLKSKQAKDVADELLDVFLLFGAP